MIFSELLVMVVSSKENLPQFQLIQMFLAQNLLASARPITLSVIKNEKKELQKEFMGVEAKS